MNAYKRYKNRLERFLQTERGKRFVNFAYSFGAAVVILGAMFKLLHFPFGNEMLFIGMATECIVFILSAFDTPIRDYNWEQVFPVLSSGNIENGIGTNTGTLHQTEPISNQPTYPGGIVTNNTGKKTVSSIIQTSSPEGGRYEIPSGLSSHTEEYGRQMENLNRTLSGLNSIYEVQLKSVSSQLATIEQINQGLNRLKDVYGDTLPDGSAIKVETGKMADQLKELNQVYSRMLHAMTIHSQDNPANHHS